MSRVITCLNCHGVMPHSLEENTKDSDDPIWIKKQYCSYSCYNIGNRMSKKDKIESAAPLKNDTNNSYMKLVNALIKLADEGNHWAFNNGDYPVFKKYPQYRKIHRLGKQIYKKSGFEGMQTALEYVKVSCRHPDQYCMGYSIVEYSWKGIGGWLP